MMFAQSFALPRDAKVTVERKVYSGTQPDMEKASCERDRSVNVSEAAMRRRFRTFHELREGEYHDGYLQLGCGVSGTVVYGGKTFQWTYEFGNTLTTNFPDGVGHTLGGKHTDDGRE